MVAAMHTCEAKAWAIIRMLCMILVGLQSLNVAVAGTLASRQKSELSHHCVRKKTT